LSNGTNLSSQNPSIVFSDEGLYTITLTASDGSSTDVETKNNYIRVLPSAAGLPFWEGFEEYSSLQNLTNWEVVNVNNNNAFTLESSFGHSGSKCVRLPNFGQQGSNVDELISQSIDVSSVPETEDITLSFRYAYRKRTSSDYELLKVFVSNNCGDTWSQKKTLGGSQLGSTASNTSWYPTSLNDWKTVHMVNINESYYTPNFRMKFRFEGEGGNNFYLDDINLYVGDPSDDLVTGLYDNTQEIGLVLYPNPAESELSVDFDLNSNEFLKIKILDLLGKVVGIYGIQGKEGKNSVLMNTQSLSSGTYILKLQGETISSSLPFVKR
jgi:PKD repeat protein